MEYYNPQILLEFDKRFQDWEDRYKEKFGLKEWYPTGRIVTKSDFEKTLRAIPGTRDINIQEELEYRGITVNLHLLDFVAENSVRRKMYIEDMQKMRHFLLIGISWLFIIRPNSNEKIHIENERLTFLT